MSRSYRRVIIAIVGLVLIGARQPSQDANQRKNSSAEQSSNRKDSSGSAAFVGSLATPSQDAGCKRGEDRRVSDLCAQWKAADSAYDSAHWTWWQLVLGVLGLVIGGATLFFAGRAAHWAKEAAKETKRTADAADASTSLAERSLTEAKQSAIDGTRPWILFEHLAVQTLRNANIRGTPNSDGYAIALMLRNFGSSPALSVRPFSKLKLTRYREVPNFDNEIHMSEAVSTIPPNAQQNATFMGITEQEVQQMEREETSVWLHTVFEYADRRASDKPFRTMITMRVFVQGRQNGFPGFVAVEEGEQNSIT